MASFAAWLSLAVGFLSLSQEILWVRLVSFTLQGSGHAFPLVLMFFLLGVAYGSSVGKGWCATGQDLLRQSARALAWAAGLDAAAVLLLPLLAGIGVALPAMLALVLAGAALKATTFPVAHHLGSQDSGPRLGRSVSRVYFANIVGCTLGPIATGYVLLDRVSIEGCLALVAVGSAALSLACARRAGIRRPPIWTTAGGAIALASLAAPPHLLIRSLTDEAAVAQVLQNRHGIVHTVGHAAEGIRVFGGNAYDGVMSVDLQANANGLDRALVLLTVHPKPERVLVVGMSAGAWTRVLSSSPEIRELVVLEINPAYVELARNSPIMAPLLSDPRVHIHIDDARRWLRQHPNERFDLIVQNTTFHWRAYSNNLLSREHLQLSRAHLKPGGIMAWNSTYSGDVLKTAQAVFAHTERRLNFIYGSDRPFAGLRPDAQEVLRALQLDGRPMFSDAAFAAKGLASVMLSEPFVPAELRQSGLNFRQPAIVTDGNLLVEQAHGSAFLHEHLSGAFAWLDRVRVVTAPEGTRP